MAFYLQSALFFISIPLLIARNPSGKSYVTFRSCWNAPTRRLGNSYQTNNYPVDSKIDRDSVKVKRKHNK